MSKVEIPLSVLCKLWRSDESIEDTHKWCIDVLDPTTLKDLMAQNKLTDEEIEYAKEANVMAFNPEDLSQDQILKAVNSSTWCSDWVKNLDDLSGVDWHRLMLRNISFKASTMKVILKSNTLSDEVKMQILITSFSSHRSLRKTCDVMIEAFNKSSPNYGKLVQCVHFATLTADRNTYKDTFKAAVDVAYNLFLQSSDRNLIKDFTRKLSENIVSVTGNKFSNLENIYRVLCRVCDFGLYYAWKEKFETDFERDYHNLLKDMITEYIQEKTIEPDDLVEFHLENLLGPSQQILSQI